MRILHCIPSMLGGGAERQLCYLVGGLVGMGHEVHVALMQEGPNGPRLRATGATVHFLPHRNPYSFLVLSDLCALIETTQAQVVQTWLARMDMWGGLAARAMKRPWICSERNVWVTHERWLDSLRRRIILQSSAIVANSSSGASFWRSATAVDPAIYVVPNTLPLEEISRTPPARPSDLGVAEGAEVILYTGRFMPNKNIALLAAVLTEVLRRRPRAVALCCGEGPLLGGMFDAVRKAGLLERCRLLGYRSDVWSLMKSADVSVSTSDREGQPNVLLEAMACGCPVVVTDIPQHREIIAPDAGLFFTPGSLDEGVSALENALDDRVAARGRALRARTAMLRTASPGAVARNYDSIYRTLGAATET